MGCIWSYNILGKESLMLLSYRYNCTDGIKFFYGINAC